MITKRANAKSPDAKGAQRPQKPKSHLPKGPYDPNLTVNEVLTFVDVAWIIKDHKNEGLKVSQKRIGEALGYSPGAFSKLLKRLNTRFKTAITKQAVGAHELRLTEKGEEIYAVWLLQRPYLARYYDLREIDMIPLIEKVSGYFNNLINEAMEPEVDEEEERRNEQQRKVLLRMKKRRQASQIPQTAADRLDQRIARMKSSKTPVRADGEQSIELDAPADGS
ncbi:hypothetical protein [Devosia nitrariae]|uniref:Uncharacterized protein n=1 Tax=Devosia nitrariae TaxID=2071872 RepID=A0ABQ5W9N2_9HYPH|nr:hypothetical protein [Devosia nitrariae]GLQ56557.1 hypothetical protein GCM10010862_38160 [Devosia nitrariae]